MGVARRRHLSDNASVTRGRRQQSDSTAAEGAAQTHVDMLTVLAALAGITAAWIAAGSTGLLAHPLRRALTFVALGVALAAVGTALSLRPRTKLLALLIAVVVSTCMVASALPPVNVMGVALLLAALAQVSAGQSQVVLGISSAAVAALGLLRFSCTAAPWVWLLCDAAGGLLGRVAGYIAHQPLKVGATFAGLDYLVLVAALWVLCLAQTAAPRKARAAYGVLAIIGGHAAYLIALAFVPVFLGAVPEPADDAGWSWAGLIHKAIPWNVPALACIIHVSIAGAMLRWSALVPIESPTKPSVRGFSIRNRAVLAGVVLVLAILTPAVAMLSPGRLDLRGKKIVVYEKGFLNWLKPRHGQYGRLSSGMYGMLPPYIESLGGHPVISADLSAEDLRDADALVLIFPDDPWAEGQLDRIWEYVRKGGRLLVMGEHTTQDEDGSSRFNEVLAPTAMQVQFDSGTFAVGGWLQSYESISHPMTAGVGDDRNQFGVVIGASLDVDWPARPLLIGRWGWSDWGDQGSGRAMMGDGDYGPGEKLGDLIVAAEQPFGKGRVIAFGDTSGITNGINVTSHVFTSRLWAYLADGSNHVHAWWRQGSALLLGIVLLGLLVWRADMLKAGLIAAGLACSLWICTQINHRAGVTYPDGRDQMPNNLAYIDSSHFEAYSGESWRPDGIGGLALTLMRNDYLTLSLGELTSERLKRAGLLISIAPGREFSRRERVVVRDFVTGGGILIVTAGYERAGPVQSLLAEFGFSIGSPRRDGPEPVAMGHFKSPYLRSGEQRAYVRYHAAWPVSCDAQGARVVAYGHDNLPVIILRRVGRGLVVVVGDTCFAMNKNLENEGGQPFEGLRENADFWRWLLAQLREQEMWIPPALQAPQEAGAGTAPADGNVGGTN